MQSVPPGGRSGENNMSIVVLGPQASPPARVETNQLYCNNAVCERTVTFPIRVARDAGRRGRLRSQDDDAHIFFYSFCSGGCETQTLPFLLLCEINSRFKLLLSISRPITTLTEIFIKLRRSVAWNAQRLPLGRSEMLRQKNNLADVIRVMHKLPVDRLNNCVFLSANRHCSGEIRWPQRLNRVKHAFPTTLPIRNHILSATRLDDKFHIAIAIRFLSITIEEVGPAGDHVARHVLHHNRNIISFFIQLDE